MTAVTLPKGVSDVSSTLPMVPSIFRATPTKRGQAVRQESWQEIESESLLLGKAVTTRRVPES